MHGPRSAHGDVGFIGFWGLYDANYAGLRTVGVSVVNRKTQNYQESAEQLANLLFKFVQQSQRDRITQRNRVESIADTFDWSNLRSYYDTAHELAVLKRVK